MKKALLFLFLIPALASGCHADHAVVVYRLSDILLPIVLVLLVVGIVGTLLYAVVHDWLSNRKRRKKQNAGE